MEFNNTINSFLNQSGNSSLIFQTYEGKSYNEFTMSSLDLTTGVVNTKLFMDSNLSNPIIFNLDIISSDDTGGLRPPDGSVIME